MKLSPGWHVRSDVRFSDGVLSQINRKIRSREKWRTIKRSIADRYYHFHDLFEAAHQSGVEVIGTALQAAVIALIVVGVIVQVAHYVQSHPSHFFGW